MPDDIPVAETRPDSEQPITQTAGAEVQPNPQAKAPDHAALEADIQQRLRAELVELQSIATQAARLGVRVDPAQALAEGMNPHALRKQVLDTAAAADQSLDIQANTPHPDAGAKQASPLVAATQRLIAQS